jgi:hypothetical protein
MWTVGMARMFFSAKSPRRLWGLEALEVKRLWCEADHSLSFSADSEDCGAVPPLFHMPSLLKCLIISEKKQQILLVMAAHTFNYIYIILINNSFIYIILIYNCHSKINTSVRADISYVKII